MKTANEVWPPDIFRPVEKEDWDKIREAIETTGYTMERVAADLMRRGYESMLWETKKEIEYIKEELGVE
ncbi:MAG: hypothetical protein J7L32_05300 [Thermoplasmata archaeon]|nr:hypothetical protein [Thermoplasmata archaeon]